MAQYTTAKLLQIMVDGQQATCVSGTHQGNVLERVGNSVRWSDGTPAQMENIMDALWEFNYIASNFYEASEALVQGKKIVVVGAVTSTTYEKSGTDIIVTQEGQAPVTKTQADALFSYNDIADGKWFIIQDVVVS